MPGPAGARPRSCRPPWARPAPARAQGGRCHGAWGRRWTPGRATACSLQAEQLPDRFAVLRAADPHGAEVRAALDQHELLLAAGRVVQLARQVAVDQAVVLA